MTSDPEAAKFLSHLLPNKENALNSLERNQYDSQLNQDAKNKMINAKIHQTDGTYKWPYYDSYAPNVPMHKPD